MTRAKRESLTKQQYRTLWRINACDGADVVAATTKSADRVRLANDAGFVNQETVRQLIRGGALALHAEMRGRLIVTDKGHDLLAAYEAAERHNNR